MPIPVTRRLVVLDGGIFEFGLFGIVVNGPTLTITATNGAPNGGFTLLASDDLARPLAQWRPILTSSFDANGVMSLSTNVVDSSKPQQFYILRTQP